MNSAVLLLNQNYEPLNVCRTRRAVVLLVKGKAEILAQRPRGIHTQRREFPWPSVIRLLYQVRRPRPVVKLSRREVFVRDDFTCQYCGSRTHDLTLDHVLPRRLGGKRRWENLVAACRRCNLRKGSRTLRDSNMRLSRLPNRPRSVFHHMLRHMSSGRFDPSWEQFLPRLR